MKIKLLIHIISIVLLTILTQIGGVIYLCCYTYISIRKKNYSWLKRFLIFIVTYLFASILIVPFAAKLGGRTALPITKSDVLRPQTYLTPLLNRHYVKKDLLQQISRSAKIFNQKHSELSVNYLDANFPFWDGFPLLPHLSHNDGKKLDLAFYYKYKGEPSNAKPSRIGYGHFEEPWSNELNQNKVCKRQYWHYDIAKYLTLGFQSDYEFDPSHTKDLIEILLKEKGTQKIFLEPHLKKRLGLSGYD